nr:30S ribosomal protein S31, mitochondrial [Ipomoea batatas]
MVKWCSTAARRMMMATEQRLAFSTLSSSTSSLLAIVEAPVLCGRGDKKDREETEGSPLLRRNHQILRVYSLWFETRSCCCLTSPKPEEGVHCCNSADGPTPEDWKATYVAAAGCLALFCLTPSLPRWRWVLSAYAHSLPPEMKRREVIWAEDDEPELNAKPRKLEMANGEMVMQHGGETDIDDGQRATAGSFPPAYRPQLAAYWRLWRRRFLLLPYVASQRGSPLFATLADYVKERTRVPRPDDHHFRDGGQRDLHLKLDAQFTAARR